MSLYAFAASCPGGGAGWAQETQLDFVGARRWESARREGFEDNGVTRSRCCVPGRESFAGRKAGAVLSRRDARAHAGAGDGSELAWALGKRAISGGVCHSAGGV